MMHLGNLKELVLVLLPITISLILIKYVYCSIKRDIIFAKKEIKKINSVGGGEEFFNKSDHKIIIHKSAKETFVPKIWSEDELIVLAYYSIFIKSGKDESILIETISSGLDRSISSIKKKLSIFNNLENLDKKLHISERAIYNHLVEIGEMASSNKLDKSVEKIINKIKQ